MCVCVCLCLNVACLCVGVCVSICVNAPVSATVEGRACSCGCVDLGAGISAKLRLGAYENLDVISIMVFTVSVCVVVGVPVVAVRNEMSEK